MQQAQNDVAHLRSTADANELVLGLVGPVGCDLIRVEDAIIRALARFRYEHRLHKLSDLFRDPELGSATEEIRDGSPEYRRLLAAMDAGDEWRRTSQRPEVMAIYAMSQISLDRGAAQGEAAPMNRVAHVLHSLKRPEEAWALREAYGQRLVLISVYVPRDERIALLLRKGMDEREAVELVARDEESGDPYGQATSDTFRLADLFLDGRRPPEHMEAEIERFLDLLFGSRLITPRRDEHAMFLAFASSLRSGDLSRQVGAVLVDEQGAILSMGCNDAPRFGGGQYWPADDDARDLALGEDANDRIRRHMIQSILERVGRWDPHVDAVVQARRVLGPEAGGLLDITEFGRAVHAEMAALMDCARRGVRTQGASLYCTTFPCHNCIKHLVAAGICKLFFIEPYPKSRAFELHGDSVSASELVESRLRMLPFVGIGPRRYAELFALQDRHGARIRRKGDGGRVVGWNPGQATPLLSESLISFLEREKRAADLMASIRDARLRSGSGEAEQTLA